MALLWFKVPFRGSPLLLLGATLLFVACALGNGLLISTISKTQQEAFLSAFLAYMPMVLLSGFMFPFRGMPGWAQTLGEVLPLTHFLRFIRAIMLKGADLAAVSQHIAVLALFVLVFAVLALSRFRRTLD